MSLILQSSGGGQITIQEPATASNFTHTLPASTGTVLTTGSPQSGGVIQVVNTTFATQTSTTSTSFVDTGLTATITPKFSSSKILVLVSSVYQAYPSANSRDAGGGFQLVRASTNIWSPSSFTNYLDIQLAAGVQVNMQNMMALNYMDSPATTSATVYKLQFQAQSSKTFVINPAGTSAPSSLILMEIAA